MDSLLKSHALVHARTHASTEHLAATIRCPPKLLTTHHRHHLRRRRQLNQNKRGMDGSINKTNMAAKKK